MLPTSADLVSMGYVFKGEPFVEVDGILYLTSPGYMGVTWDGQPVTFAPVVIAPPVEFRRVNFELHAGGMGIKPPHRP